MFIFQVVSCIVSSCYWTLGEQSSGELYIDVYIDICALKPPYLAWSMLLSEGSQVRVGSEELSVWVWGWLGERGNHRVLQQFST
jgi:hypothetical protein